MNQMAERMISNKSPAKATNTIKGTSLKGFFVRGPFDFSIIRTLKPACGPQPAKNKGLKNFYQCCSRLDPEHITARSSTEPSGRFAGLGESREPRVSLSSGNI